MVKGLLWILAAILSILILNAIILKIFRHGPEAGETISGA